VKFSEKIAVVVMVVFAVLRAFLRGVLGKMVFWWWLNRGENVVNCVVNVVFERTYFEVFK
jgi:hypothetical protein